MTAPEVRETKVRKAVRLVTDDVIPQSPEHTLRLIAGAVMLGAATWKFLQHSGVWDKNDLIAILGFTGAACLIVFTKTTLAALKLALVWRKPA